MMISLRPRMTWRRSTRFPACWRKRAVVALNRAFLAVARKRPDEAKVFFQAGENLADSIALPDVGASITLLNGLVAWSGGDLAGAEKLLRAAIATLPGDEQPHVYLAQLLAARGDAAGAACRDGSASVRCEYSCTRPVGLLGGSGKRQYQAVLRH